MEFLIIEKVLCCAWVANCFFLGIGPMPKTRSGAFCRMVKKPAPVSGIEQPHLKVAIISVTATYVPLYLAVDDGLFAKEGLQVELLPFRGGSDLIKAVVSRSADVGVVSLAEVTSAIAAGQSMKAFYGGFNVPAFDWYAGWNTWFG